MKQCTMCTLYIVQLYSPVVKNALGKGYIIRSKELDKIWCRFKSATCCMCYMYSIYRSLSNPSHFRCCLGGPVEEESCSALLQQQRAPRDEVGSDFLFVLARMSAKGGGMFQFWVVTVSLFSIITTQLKVTSSNLSLGGFGNPDMYIVHIVVACTLYKKGTLKAASVGSKSSQLYCENP